ncbi:MAG: hypothetical protein WA688_00755 [Thermoplasmata archaeon]
MVWVTDWGSEFDAPLDVVWKYLQSDDDHGESHKGRRNLERKSINENTVMLNWEQIIEGNWVKMSNRLTFHPPIGFFVEPMEGPMAGSKFFNYYVPKGDKTAVIVVGDWNSKMIPAAQLEKAVMANLQHVFEEDTDGLKTFRKKATK